jgi:hypothetical protein
MNSFNDTINTYIEIGTATEMYFKRKVQTKGEDTGKLNGYFVVKGIIKKPAGFNRRGALVMDVHDIGKK